MKQLKLTLIAVFAFATVSTVNAQDDNNPWTVGLSVNIIDFNNGDKLVDDYFGRDDWDVSKFFSRISAGKYLGSGFTLDAAFSMAEITDFGGSTAPVEYNYFALDVNARYDLNEAFGDTSWFDPYTYAGLGYAYLDGDEKLRGMTFNFGVGMNFWTGDNFGINYQTGIKTGLGDDIENHFQHSLGIVFRFGGNSDDSN